ncbi:hypothetical protein GCM10023147_12700 [Tsukamurella soli]|uniref:Uncharacterized protein n=1 Tax=Tsukamurella soli TaxID=644556 RepID=A0ABP8JAN3_9ACTN
MDRLLRQYNVEGEGSRRLHREPGDPDAWTDITVEPSYIAFDRPGIGEVWELIYALMVECGAALYDPTENYVVPSEAVKLSLPQGYPYNSVLVAHSASELLARICGPIPRAFAPDPAPSRPPYCARRRVRYAAAVASFAISVWTALYSAR